MAETVSITLRLFAVFREALGSSTLEQKVPVGTTVGQVLARLIDEYPALVGAEAAVSFSVNRSYASADTVLHAGDEVAFIPPVSGGGPSLYLRSNYAMPTAKSIAKTTTEKVETGHFRILERLITADELIPHVLTDAYGAVATFSGTVRNHARGKHVTGLTYEAYPEMAEAEMRKIAVEVYAQWPECQVAMLHRIGKLEIGDVSVAIAVATPHRKESFEACEFAINRLKETVPIWKKEAYADGEVWVEGVSPSADGASGDSG